MEKRNGNTIKHPAGTLTEMHLLQHLFMMREKRHNDYNSKAETKCSDLCGLFNGSEHIKLRIALVWYVSGIFLFPFLSKRFSLWFVVKKKDK